MAKPPTSVRSIRLQNDVWAWLAEEAARRETTVNRLVDVLIEVARLKVAERAAQSEPAPKVVKPKLVQKAEPTRAAPKVIAVSVPLISGKKLRDAPPRP